MRRTIFRFASSKYNNEKVVFDGIKFDSKLEKNRWIFLNLMQDEGEISDLQRQVEFELIPAQYVDIPRFGKDGTPLKPKRLCVERSVSYNADFTYIRNGELIIEDTKSAITRKNKEYIIKRKLMRLHGNPISEVTNAYRKID